MVFEVVHQYLEVIFWVFDVVAWHTSEEQTKTQGNMSFSDIFFCCGNDVRFVSVQKSEAVKVRLLHYIMSGNCTSTSFRVRERRNFFIIKNSVKQLKLEGFTMHVPLITSLKKVKTKLMILSSQRNYI